MSITAVRWKRDVSLGLKNLLLHKLRSFLTMLGLVFGVGSVIAMLAIGEGASADALERIRRLGSQNILLEARTPPKEQNQQNVWMLVYGLLYEDADRLATTIPSIDAVVPYKSVDKPGRYRDRQEDMRVVCTTEKWFDLVQRDLLAGRALVASDVRESQSVAVLTEWGARRFLANEHAVGDTVVIGGESFRVVGIVRSETGGANAADTPDKPTDVYIPLSTARQRYGDYLVTFDNGTRKSEMVELHGIIAHVADEHKVEATANSVARLLETSHKKKDYAVNVPLRLLREAEATKRTFSIVLGAIAGISLLVGGIGIMNIMLASVTERTREIGIRRAIGARRSQIVTQFLIEALVLSVCGGAIGMALGVTIPLLVTLLAGMSTVVTLWSLVLSFGISVGVGIGFGIYPAIRASKLDPIIALRYE